MNSCTLYCTESLSDLCNITEPSLTHCPSAVCFEMVIWSPYGGASQQTRHIMGLQQLLILVLSQLLEIFFCVSNSVLDKELVLFLHFGFYKRLCVLFRALQSCVRGTQSSPERRLFVPSFLVCTDRISD